MDAKQNIENLTPSKTIFNSVHGKLAHSTFNSESPFRRLPNFSTPPSRFAKIKNPFEHHLAERLHTPFFSPSVFKVSNSNVDEKFRWTIDDISFLKPADIDETTIDLHETTEHDSMMESRAQAKIDLFFSDSVAPSPSNQLPKSSPLINEGDSSIKETKKTFSNGIAQTVLTLPPRLPDHVEAVLRPYFSYMEQQQQCDLSANTSLYKKLFDFEENDNESVDSSPPHSLILSPITALPDNLKNSDLDVHVSPFNLDECNLSPIEAHASYDYADEKSKHEFSGYMSIDNSMNVVPDGYELRSDSVNFDSTQSSMREVLSDSTVHWDMEYKHVLLCTPSKNFKEMDVSNSNTPRSKIFMSQRKKLSDSFLQEHDDFENKENMEECVERRISNEHDHLYAKQDVTDAGYQTGIHTLSENSSWCNSSNLYASTPTKKLNQIN